MDKGAIATARSADALDLITSILATEGQVSLSNKFDRLDGQQEAKSPIAARGAKLAMSSRPFKTMSELQDLIVAQARALHGPWPAGMTLFVFDDAYGWSASISRPASEGDNFYRICTLDLITRLKAKYDLDTPCLPDRDDIF